MFRGRILSWDLWLLLPHEAPGQARERLFAHLPHPQELTQLLLPGGRARPLCLRPSMLC